jgi:SAM-dependent methyltransferase
MDEKNTSQGALTDAGNMDHWAKYCDIIWTGYDQDVEFYKKEAKKAEGKVLEVGCGTGRIYLEILKDGCDIRGIDLSTKALEILKEKAGDLEPKVHEADMRDFDLDERFSLAIIPFRTFSCNLTTEDQLSTLRSVRKHLLPGGSLALDIFYPSPGMIRITSESKIIEKEIPDGYDARYRLRNRSRFADDKNIIISWTSSLYRNDDQIWEGEGSIALIHLREFELLLKVAGFGKWSLYGDFEYGPFDPSKKDMVWVVQNEG